MYKVANETKDGIEVLVIPSPSEEPRKPLHAFLAWQPANGLRVPSFPSSSLGMPMSARLQPRNRGQHAEP